MDYCAIINCAFNVMYCHPEKYILNMGKFIFYVSSRCGVKNPAYTSAVLVSSCLRVARIAPPTCEWAASQISSPSSCSLSAPEATAVRCGDARRRAAVDERMRNGRASGERHRGRIES